MTDRSHTQQQYQSFRKAVVDSLKDYLQTNAAVLCITDGLSIRISY
jgi:hypothetical protein